MTIESPVSILVVDDNPVDREAITRLLQPDGGYRLRSAASGEEALELCASELPDCVLLDLELPGRSGLELLPELVPLQIAVVMLTGRGDESVSAACWRAGAHDYLTKRELHRETLSRVVRSAIDRARLARQVELYRRMVEQLPTAAVILRWQDRSDIGAFHVVTANPAAHRTPQLCAAEGAVLGRELPALLAGPLLGALAQAVETQSTVELPELIVGEPAQPSFVFSGKAVPLAGDLVSMLVEDVTAHRAAEARSRSYEQRMVAAERMESIGRLAGGIAHDFNNVLSVVQSYSLFLRDRFADGDPGQSDADAIIDAAQRAAKLTSQLLAFSRQQVQQLQTIDLSETVEKFDRMLRALLREDVRVRTSLARDLWPVDVDPGHIEQVLVNLAVNARDAMPAGGLLEIETANVEVPAEQIDRGELALQPGPYVRLRVTDSGCGMDAPTRARIFEPFFTTKGPDLGTGLGLSTVYGVVSQSGGFVEVASEPDRGTCFAVYLPRAEHALTERQEIQAPVSVAGPRATVLLVEDEMMVRRAARRILEREGYSVLEAGGGRQAIALLESQEQSIDLLLTDIIMPEMDGRELANTLQLRWPRLQVVFMSGYAEDGLDTHRQDGRRIGFVQKPFSPDSLCGALREALMATGPNCSAT